jgi:ATP-dependent protease ClpP protease subunit
MSKPGIQLLEINDEDMNGFMATVHKLDRTLGLDLILHTPGGSIASTEAIMRYLHDIFGTNIRAIVPQVAMSAGTMVACSCKEILMGRQSSLGPIDPHLRGIPAQGVIEEFNTALMDYKTDPNSIVVWKEVLAKYHPTFIGQCKNAVKWTKEFVTAQLEANMFLGDPEAVAKATSIVDKLSDHSDTKSHERHISVATCEELGLKVKRIEEDQQLQDLILTVHHCFFHTVANTPCIKIIENHTGSAFVKSQVTVPQLFPMGAGFPPGFPGIQKPR